MKKIRLQKFFTDCGIMSRRAAENEITAGKVTVNGTVAEIGQKIDPQNDIVVYMGRQIVYPDVNRRATYIMLNKPIGYVTTMSDEKSRKTVSELVSDVGRRIYPVGRLDMYSEGLLIMTDDGEFANKLMHPSHMITKTYKLRVKGALSEEDTVKFTLPMEIDGYNLKPVKAKLIASGDVSKDGTVSSSLRIILSEGRNRQIRKMCEQLGFTVLSLKRIAIGKLKLGDLPVGKWRALTDEEIAYLKNNESLRG